MTNEMKTKPDEPKYYDAFDVARILRIHHKTALIWGKRGMLPPEKSATRRYFPAEGILAFKKQEK